MEKNISENSAGAAGIFVKESLQNEKIKKNIPKFYCFIYNFW